MIPAQPREDIDFNICSVPADAVLTLNHVPNNTVRFHTADGTVVGTFDFNQVPATFTGDVDASAKIFVEAVINIFNARSII